MKASEVVARGRQEGTRENEGEQPVRQGSGSGRRECAPRRTREKDHLGALGKLAEGRFLATAARKLGAVNRTHAVALAIRHKIISP